MLRYRLSGTTEKSASIRTEQFELLPIHLRGASPTAAGHSHTIFCPHGESATGSQFLRSSITIWLSGVTTHL